MGVCCQIHLEKRPEGYYKPGDVVSGAVKYAIDKDTTFKDIFVTLEGRGTCNWLVSSNNGSRIFYNREDYVNSIISLLNKNNNEEVSVKAGAYSHFFRFRLPLDIPSSYKDDIGKIIYSVKLTFEKKGALKSNKAFQTEIPVVNFLDVTMPREPVTYGAKKSPSTLFKSGENVIDVKVTVKNPALAPGDIAELYVEVNNDTNTKIPTIETQLMKEVTYLSSCDNKNFNVSLVKGVKTESVSVNKKSTVNFTSRIQIPEGLFSIYSKVMAKEYKLKVTIKLPFPHKDFVISVPLVIGGKVNEETVVEEGDIGFDLQSLPDDPPPSYWEIMKEFKEDKSMAFIPK